MRLSSRLGHEMSPGMWLVAKVCCKICLPFHSWAMDLV